MRSYEDVVLDDGMMPGVVATPKRHVGSDLGERLDGVVFKDKTVLLQLETTVALLLGYDTS